MKTYFIVCGKCNHHVNINNILMATKLPSTQAIKESIHKLSCSNCGSKSAILKEKPQINQKVIYVATMQSSERVFHRNTCGWLRHVTSGDEFTFKNREAALSRGYKPCTSCKP